MENKKILAVKCLAYNHEKTIKQTLDGIIMQKTDYPFDVIIHDDASTDSTADIIRDYERKYPNLIKPIYEIENQYSKGNGILSNIVENALKGYKYVALCEGDDYWINKNKIQKQIDFLENNSEYSMCCTDAVVITPEGKESWPISDRDIDLKVEDLIKRGGLYIATASIVYRNDVKDNYPDYCIKCAVGDHPLQIMCGLKGKVKFFSEKMVAYRYNIGNSWTATRKKTDINKLIKSWKSSLYMLEGLNEYSKFKYKDAFYKGEINIIMRNVSNNLQYGNMIYNELVSISPDCVKHADLKNKIKIILVKLNLTKIWGFLKKMR